MKILHTADWHLGKYLDRFSRIEEQREVMDEIISITNEQEVDLVLVAGDLFDSFNPGTEAIELFYKTLKRLSNNGKRPVIAISGNHDSPNLIDAPDPLARECGIILIGHPNTTVIPFNNEHFSIRNSIEGMFEIWLEEYEYPVRIMHTPYANETRLRQYFGENKKDALNTLLSDNWEKIATTHFDDTGVNLLVAHLYINSRGAELLEEPEGERPIKVGNADLVYSDAIPSQVQYTALGHLHSFKNVGTASHPAIYSSSPLSYSFSEAGQTKYVVIINAHPGSRVEYEKISLKKGKPLIRKTFNSVDLAVSWLQAHPEYLVELTIESETFLKTAERKALYESHGGIVYLIPKLKNTKEQSAHNGEIDLNREMTELFKDYFKSKFNGQEPNEELMDLFNEIRSEQ